MGAPLECACVPWGQCDVDPALEEAEGPGLIPAAPAAWQILDKILHLGAHLSPHRENENQRREGLQRLTWDSRPGTSVAPRKRPLFSSTHIVQLPSSGQIGFGTMGTVYACQSNGGSTAPAVTTLTVALGSADGIIPG